MARMIAFAEFEKKIYWGTPSDDDPEIWNFREINGNKHFRAKRESSSWICYESNHEKIHGIVIEDKNRTLLDIIMGYS